MLVGEGTMLPSYFLANQHYNYSITLPLTQSSWITFLGEGRPKNSKFVKNSKKNSKFKNGFGI